MQQREKWKQRGSCSFKLLKANKSELTKWFKSNAAKGRSTFLQASVVNDGLSKAGSPAGAGRRSPWLPDMAKLSRNQNEWVSADGWYLLIKALFWNGSKRKWEYARNRRPETHKSHSSRRASDQCWKDQANTIHHPQEKVPASAEYFEGLGLMDTHARGLTESPNERQYVPFRAC